MAEGGGGDLKLESAPYDNKGAAQVAPPVTDLVRKSIVFIKAPSIKGPGYLELGTGSIVKFKDKPWLMTCAHVIPTEDFARKSRIFFDKVSGIDSDDEESIDYTGEELLDFESAPLIDEDLDVALIAIKSGKVPKLDGGKQRLELDLAAYLRNGSDCSAKKNDLMKLWHYPREGKFSLQSSSYVVRAVSGFCFSHGAETHPGSSGAPVFKSHGGMEVLVGLHRGSLTKSSPVGLNVATHIHAIWCLLSKEEHGFGVPNLDVLGLKGSGKEGSSKVPVQLESSGQGPKYFDSKKFMTKYYPGFPKKVKAQSIALKLKIEEAIENKLYHKIKETYEEDAGQLLYDELWASGIPDQIKKVCKAMEDEAGNPQMNQLGADMLADPDLELPCEPNKK